MDARTNPFLPEKSTPFPTKALPSHRPCFVARVWSVSLISLCACCVRETVVRPRGEKKDRNFSSRYLWTLCGDGVGRIFARRGREGGGKRPKKKIAASVCVRTDTLRTYTHNNFALLAVASAGGPPSPSRSLWWVLYCECPSQIPPPHHLTQPFPTLPSYLEADEDSKIAACERVIPLFCHLSPPDTKPMFPPYQFPPFSSISLPVPPSLRLCRCCLFCLSSVGRC